MPVLFMQRMWTSTGFYNTMKQISIIITIFSIFLTPVFAFQPQTKAELQTAVRLWIDNNAAALSTYGEINTWDVSLITDMSYLFNAVFTFNDDISNWDVSNVTDMEKMFCQSGYNNSLEGWDVSNVSNMNSMFYWANTFTGIGLENWDVSGAVDMTAMFGQNHAFNRDISGWNTSNVERTTHEHLNL